VFSCVIAAQPTEVEGYRGRIEAELMLGRYSDAVLDQVRVNSFVLPVHPDAESIVLGGYNARLAVDPDSVTALTGASFTRWWNFQYAEAIHLLNHLLQVAPDDPYGNLFRGSNRMLLSGPKARGIADLERGIALAPDSPDAHYIAADAYTYGLPDPQRALAEATIALDGGLDTPRVHAIFGSSYLALGDLAGATAEYKTHIDLVTTELLSGPALERGGSLSLDLVPGRTYEIPVPAVAGQTMSIRTSSRDFFDTICVLLGPDGSPVVGSDDFIRFFAGFDFTAASTGTYRLRVTSFESSRTGALSVTRR
jgi:tetratricopeptide (TPR) repeat protein